MLFPLDKEATEIQINRRGGHLLWYSRVGKSYSVICNSLLQNMIPKYGKDNELPYFYIISIDCPCVSRGSSKCKIGESGGRNHGQRLQEYARMWNNYKVHMIRVFSKPHMAQEFERHLKNSFVNLPEDAPAGDRSNPADKEFFFKKDLSTMLDRIELLDADPEWSADHFEVYRSNPSRVKSKMQLEIWVTLMNFLYLA